MKPIDKIALEMQFGYNPDQPRDEHGRFGSTGSAGEHTAQHEDPRGGGTLQGQGSTKVGLDSRGREVFEVPPQHGEGDNALMRYNPKTGNVDIHNGESWERFLSRAGVHGTDDQLENEADNVGIDADHLRSVLDTFREKHGGK